MRITIENTTKSYDRTIVLMRLVTVILFNIMGHECKKIAFTFKLLIAIASDAEDYV